MSIEFEELKGKVLSSITGCVGDSKMIFVEDNGKKYKLYNPECGFGNDVSINIDDIVGDLDDIVGSPILLAEEVSNRNDMENTTWTFYKLSTIKGSVTIKLYGYSNGYYAESAFLEECDDNWTC